MQGIDSAPSFLVTLVSVIILWTLYRCVVYRLRIAAQPWREQLARRIEWFKADPQATEFARNDVTFMQETVFDRYWAWKAVPAFLFVVGLLAVSRRARSGMATEARRLPEHLDDELSAIFALYSKCLAAMSPLGWLVFALLKVLVIVVLSLLRRPLDGINLLTQRTATFLDARRRTA